VSADIYTSVVTPERVYKFACKMAFYLRPPNNIKNYFENEDKI
jgi:hypothetical protein